MYNGMKAVFFMKSISRNFRENDFTKKVFLVLGYLPENVDGPDPSLGNSRDEKEQHMLEW